MCCMRATLRTYTACEKKKIAFGVQNARAHPISISLISYSSSFPSPERALSHKTGFAECTPVRTQAGPEQQVNQADSWTSAISF